MHIRAAINISGSRRLLFKKMATMVTSQKRTKQKPLTWMMFGPCRRGIPRIQRTAFSSITHQANHDGPLLLQKKPMSNPWQSAGDLTAVVAPGLRSATSNPPSLDCNPDKSIRNIHHFKTSSGACHHRYKLST